MTASSLTFSAEGKKFGSNWFSPDECFYLKLKYSLANKNKERSVEIYCSTDSNGADASLAGFVSLSGQETDIFPVFDVIEGCGIYFKVVTSVEPISGSYITA